MSVLKVTLSVFVLAFSMSDVLCLTCLCENDVCNGNTTKCDQPGDVCYAALIRLKDSTKAQKGCRPKGECDNVDYCPDEGLGSECAKFGCCDYDKCVVNYTLGKDFETPSPSPSPTVGLASTSTMKVPMVSSVVPTAEKTKASSPAAIATSSFAAKMTSEPLMQASKSKSSMVVLVKSTPSRTTDGVYKSEALKEFTRPPCDATGRMLSLGAFFLTAIGLLCVLL